MVTERFTHEIRNAFGKALNEFRVPRIGTVSVTALWRDIHGIGTGKLIRPRLFLHVLADGGVQPDDEHFRIAAGIEIIHQFACIHDDIVDRSDKRRGIPTLHTVLERNCPGIGTDAALIAGDALYSHGLRCICEAACIRKHPAVLTRLLEYATLTSVGQYEELAGAPRNHETIRDLYTLKTACYTFAAPILSAAELTGAGAAELNKLEDASITAGVAYQLSNDLKDINGAEGEGTAGFDDFRMNRKNAVYLLLEKKVEGDDRRLLQECRERDNSTVFRQLLTTYGIAADIKREINTLLESLPRWLREFFI